MNTHNIPFVIKRQITLNYPKSAAMGFFTGLKNGFETAVVNEPTVFEPLKFYCMRQVLIKNENCFKRCEFFIIAMSQLLLILNMCYR